MAGRDVAWMHICPCEHGRGYPIYACSILTDHWCGLVFGRHARTSRSGQRARELRLEGLHPLADFERADGSIPSPWAESFRGRFSASIAAMWSERDLSFVGIQRIFGRENPSRNGPGKFVESFSTGIARRIAPTQRPRTSPSRPHNASRGCVFCRCRMVADPARSMSITNENAPFSDHSLHPWL